jgi:paraquat-inducible protein B
MKLQLESVQSMLSGGVTFAVPPNAEEGEIASADTKFTLYPDASEARDAVYTRRVNFMLHFAEPVPGLAVGAQVRMQGLQIGEVTDVHIEYDNSTGKLFVPITIQIEADRVTLLHGKDDPVNFEANVRQGFRNLIAQGLRARLGSGNLLTGQKVIDLNLVQDAPPAQMIEGGKYAEIPTMEADDLDSVMRSARALLNSLQLTVSMLNRAAASPEMAQSLKSLSQSLANLDHITKEVAQRVGPLLQSLQSAGDSANTAMSSGNGGGDFAGTLREVKSAARSTRILTEYLDSHPEALLRGKPGSPLP